jgi:hypothetical protein
MEKQSLQQFGATIKTKYPQYQDMSDEELGSKMLAKYPQYQDMIQTESPVNRDEGAFEKMMGSKGLFDIPVAGGIARGIAHPLLKGAEITAEGVNSGIDMAKNLPKIMAGEGLPAYEPKFVSPATYENLSGDLPTATTEALRSGAGAAASFLLFLIPQLLPFLILLRQLPRGIFPALILLEIMQIVRPIQFVFPLNQVPLPLLRPEFVLPLIFLAIKMFLLPILLKFLLKLLMIQPVN